MDCKSWITVIKKKKVEVLSLVAETKKQIEGSERD
jgi:hypothetical protein